MFVPVLPAFWIITVLSIATAPRAVASQTLSGTTATTASPRLQPSRATGSVSVARTFASTALLGQFNAVQNAAQSNMTSSVKQHLGPALLREVHDFWFEHFASPDSFAIPSTEDSKRWFMGGEELDRVCVERFAPTLEALRESGVKSGADILDAVQPTDPRDWLSLILLLDQITRNCYRGASSTVAFTLFDPIAREISLAAITRDIPDTDPQIRWQFGCRNWFYMPLMHSEDMAAHEMAVAEYERMRRDVYTLVEEGDEGASNAGDEYRRNAARVVRDNVGAAEKLVNTYVDFEKMHFDIIKRFGRYPHRNKAMGRESTAEEVEYLKCGGETFAK